MMVMGDGVVGWGDGGDDGGGVDCGVGAGWR